jgi:hypothetical protein
MLRLLKDLFRSPRPLRESGPIFDRITMMQRPDVCDTCNKSIGIGEHAVMHYRLDTDSGTRIHLATTCCADFGIKVELPMSLRDPGPIKALADFSVRMLRKVS